MYDQGTMELPFSFILARRGDSNLLIDTGFMKNETGANFSDKFGIPWWISPVRMLSELGLAPGDITDIIFSHAHFDHMGSIGEFPNARLIPAEAGTPVLARGNGPAPAIRLPHGNH